MSEQLEQGGRGADGRFATGNAGGPGNPFAKQTARMRAEALSELSADEIRQLMRRLYVNGMRGDVASAKLVLAYTIGKPERVADGQHFGDEPVQPVELKETVAVPAGVGAEPPQAGEPSGDNSEAKTPFVDGAKGPVSEPPRPHVSVRDMMKTFTPEMVKGLAKLTNPKPPRDR